MGFYINLVHRVLAIQIKMFIIHVQDVLAIDTTTRGDRLFKVCVIIVVEVKDTFTYSRSKRKTVYNFKCRNGDKADAQKNL